jgi:hypothetical protein
MSKQMAVYIYLPEQYNAVDGTLERKPVEEEKFAMTTSEIVQKYEACTWNGQNQGMWMHRGKLYSDRIRILMVIADDTEDNRKWNKEYVKNVLIPRFDQIAILMETVPHSMFELISAGTD